ncbi:hypothetical protein GYB22_10300 [bacterium]|nr:hypothetical protein [bacterium]
MKKFLLVGVLGLFTLGSQAQSDFKDRFFLGFVSQYYIDFITSPLRIVDRSVLVDPINNIYSPDSAVPYQTRYVNFISIGLEPRYNILELSENMAFAVSAPATIGFGQAIPANNDVLGAQGYGSFQLPLLAKFYLGSTATYESTEDIGLSVGAGFELNKVALFTFQNDGYDDNKAWIMPVVSGSFHFWRGSSPFEVNVKYGFGQETTYFRNKNGQQLSNGSRTTRASSLKLSFAYLLNY